LLVAWIIIFFFFADKIISSLNSTTEINQINIQVIFGFFGLGVILLLGSSYSIFRWNQDYRNFVKEKLNLGVNTIDDLVFIKKYKAPDLETAKLISSGNFPDFEAYQVAQQVGAANLSELHLVERYKTPNYEIAKKVREGRFSTYKSYQEAQEVGAKSKDEFMFIRRYNASDYPAALELFRNECEQKLKSALIQNGRIIIADFISDNNLQKFKSSIIKEIIYTIDFQGVFSIKDEIIVSIDFFRNILKEASRHYADIPYNIIADAMDVPEKYIPDILLQAIDTNIVIGRLDRINDCIIIREIPDSLTDRLISGEIITVGQIKKSIGESLDASCKILQRELSSNSFVLIRQGSIIKIENITTSCQICAETKVGIELFLKCKKCKRDLCWDHYEELSELDRTICPYCDDLLEFLPKYCEKCHVDFIQIPKKEDLCEFCGYPLSVKKHLTDLYKRYLAQQQNQKAPRRTDDKISKSKKPNNLD
jgi:hypothetical protein